MAIAVCCSKCGAMRHVPETLAGRKAKCPCGQVVVIPSVQEQRQKMAVMAARATVEEQLRFKDELPVPEEPLVRQPKKAGGGEVVEDLDPYLLNEDELEILEQTPPPAVVPPVGYITSPVVRCAGCGGMFAPHMVYASPSGPVCGVCSVRLGVASPAVPTAIAPPPMQRRRSAAVGGNALTHLIVGAVLCALGIGITAFTYSQAASGANGGRYTIMYGMIIWGAVHIFRGLGGMISG